MQDSYSIFGVDGKVWKGTLKVVLLVLCLWFIYQKVEEKTLDLSVLVVDRKFLFIIFITSILMVMNWYLESKRWQISIGHFQGQEMKTSWKVILRGQALNWIMPLSFGDFLSRITDVEEKKQAVSAVIFNRALLIALTFIFGIFSFSFFTNVSVSPFIIIPVGGLLIFLLIYYVRSKLRVFINYFIQMESGQYLEVIFLSVLRYSIFVFQFFLVLRFFNPSIQGIILIAGIGFIFFTKTFLPSFLGGFGIRESAGIVFFERYIENLSLILIPVVLVWLINVVVPSIVGAFMLVKLRPNK